MQISLAYRFLYRTFEVGFCISTALDVTTSELNSLQTYFANSFLCEFETKMQKTSLRLIFARKLYREVL